MTKCHYHFRSTQFNQSNSIRLNEKNIISKDNYFVNHLIFMDQNIPLIIENPVLNNYYFL